MKSDMEYEALEPSGEFASSIGDFRSAVTHVAGRETAQPVSVDWLVPARHRHRRAQLRVGLGIAVGWACAALLCVATLPLFTHPHHAAVAHVVTVSPAAAVTVESDSALLEQVDTNISESVPTPLEPLAELESWNSTSTNTSGDSVNGTSLNQTEKTNVAH